MPTWLNKGEIKHITDHAVYSTDISTLWERVLPSTVESNPGGSGTEQGLGWQIGRHTHTRPYTQPIEWLCYYRTIDRIREREKLRQSRAGGTEDKVRQSRAGGTEDEGEKDSNRRLTTPL